MKAILIYTVLVSATYSCFSQTKTIVYDSTPFDSVSAKSMITEGTATIEGVAFARSPGQITGKSYPPKGTVVYLFPYTDYFKDYLALAKKHQHSKTKVYMSKAAFAQRLETKTGKGGQFTFTNLKPGKYFVETVVYFTGTQFYDERVGSNALVKGNTVIASTPVYEKMSYNYDAAKHKTEIVTIRTDGEHKKIKL